MKEQDLIDLGFQKNYVSEEESGDIAFHYYTLDFDNLCLISNSDDMAEKDGGWSVEIFDYQSIRISNVEDLKTLIDIFKRNINYGEVS